MAEGNRDDVARGGNRGWANVYYLVVIDFENPAGCISHVAIRTAEAGDRENETMAPPLVRLIKNQLRRVPTLGAILEVA